MSLARLNHHHGSSVQRHLLALHLQFSRSFQHNEVFSVWMMMANFASTNLGSESHADLEW
jgi:hypothetical protein